MLIANKSQLWTVAFGFILMLMGCEHNVEQHKIVFQPTYLGKPITCQSLLIHHSSHWQYQQIQMFISNIELKDRSGKWSLAPLQISAYQTADIAFIGEYCLQDQHWQMTFADNFALSKAQSIRFTLGVPFKDNHLNPLTQASPLNIPSMFWGWQKGHKFLRLEMASVKGEDNWLFHLGSVGCLAPSPLRAPKQPCLHTNSFDFEVDLRSKNPSSDEQKMSPKKINFDLSILLNNIQLNASSGCQSAPDNPLCQQLMKNLAEQNKPVFLKVSH